MWFKANADSLRHEAAVVERIAARRPDVVPPLLAADAATGWMLMADAGETLRTVVARERSLDRWLDVLPLYAGVQLDLAERRGRPAGWAFRTCGSPRCREAYEQLMDEIGAERRFRDAAPRVADLCDELAAYGIARDCSSTTTCTTARSSCSDGRHLVIDWGDACISHPFFTLSVTLEGVLAWGLDDVENSVDTAPFRDAYLAPYAERYDGDLVAATRVALRLGWACRAVNGHVPGDDERTFARLRMFLDGQP